MEPRIQYARTSDGVSIAFWTLGEGEPPLVMMPAGPWSHIQLEWQAPGNRAWYERLAEKRRIIRYDGRGSGLSDRDVTEYSLDACVRDLQAVVDRLGLKRFALWAPLFSGVVSVAYAAQYPGLVSHLILWSSFVRGSDFWRSKRTQAFTAIRETDWDLYTEVMTTESLGRRPANEEETRRAASFLRDAVTPEGLKAFMDAARDFDVAAQLTQLRTSALVLHRRETFFDVATARELASRIPDARLAVLEGQAIAPHMGDMEAVASAIDDFLREREDPPPDLPSGTAIILFADIADSTALTERLGDTAFRSQARELDTALRAVIRENGGTPIEGKLLGDGVLAVFTSARHAIEAALACGRSGDETGLPLHLGLHAGDVIREEDPDGRGNVYGGAVNIAARVSALSAPGEVLVSQTVRDLARTSAGVSFEERGERELKGVGEAVRVWAVRS